MKLNKKSMDKLVALHEGEDRDLEGMTPVFLKAQAGGLTRIEKWNGREWFVAQTVAVISKVLNGELLPAQEVALFAEAWNGRPVPLNHPQVNGFFVSANSPAVMDEFNLGYFFNARAESHELGAKLVGEMWLDIALIEAKGGPAFQGLTTLRQGGTVEVSTAYFCLVRDEEGEFNGERYNGVQYNIKPDHVAFLPTIQGACSVEDGCGVNANSSHDRDDSPVVNLEAGQTAMIGVFLQPESAAVLRMEDQSAPPLTAVQDLHVTLAYLGEGDQVTVTQNDLSELVDYVSRQLYAHTVGISGTFRFFGEGPDGDAVGYLVEGETLEMTRRILVDELGYMGQTVSRAGNWVPHITVGYTSDGGFTPPSPGVDRFGVQAITVAYGNETVRFPLRGELGQSYQTMGEKTMAKNEELTPCGGQNPSVNSDGGEDTSVNPPADVTEDSVATPVVPAELQSFMDEVQAAGGVQAIMDALAQVTAANAATRNGAVERIQAMTTVYSEADLKAMSLNQLTTLADALSSVQATQKAPTQKTAANYAAAAGGGKSEPATNVVHVEGIGDLIPWSDED